MTTPTILPVLTPQQQMALAFRDFAKPEGTVTPDGVKVWTTRPDGEWAEAFGKDVERAVRELVTQVARP
ncbi:MAG TPA: hypothetical protein VFX15_03265 [Actinomycetes bacterium]|nr:hypothetical protein [Actinomycetes bacterium]